MLEPSPPRRLEIGDTAALESRATMASEYYATNNSKTPFAGNRTRALGNPPVHPVPFFVLFAFLCGEFSFPAFSLPLKN